MNANEFTVTPEEDFAFQQLENKLMTTPTTPTLPTDHIPLVETPSTTINTHTGAQYQAFDFSPNKRPDPQHIINQIAALLSQLVSVITPAPTPQPTEGLNETVSTVLENADWFDAMVKEHVDQAVAYMNIDNQIEELVKSEIEDRVGDEISHYMSRTFDIDDHINIQDRVNDALDDTLSDAVDSALDDKLEDAITELLSDKTITINL